MAILTQSQMKQLGVITYLIGSGMDTAAYKIWADNGLTIVDVLGYHSRVGNDLNMALRDVRAIEDRIIRPTKITSYGVL